MNNDKLKKQRVLITGVSRPMGIGYTLAEKFLERGATVLTHGYEVYDKAINYSDAGQSYEEHFVQLASSKETTVYPLTSSDLSQKNAAEGVIKEALEYVPFINGMVLNHAYSTHAEIGTWSEEHIAKHLDVNVKASMLLVQGFVNQLPENEEGVITLFTSGQYLGPMSDEIAYAVSKDAIIGLCRQLSATLGSRHIRVNCVKPGPTDTGYSIDEAHNEIASRFPSKKWGIPDDIARLVLFLHSNDGRWITGQVIGSEGGFNRYL